MPRMHTSPVLRRQVLIIEKGPIEKYRSFHHIADEQMILTEREVRILKQMETDGIRTVGVIKSVFPSCEVVQLSEGFSEMFTDLHMVVQHYPEHITQMVLS